MYPLNDFFQKRKPFKATDGEWDIKNISDLKWKESTNYCNIKINTDVSYKTLLILKSHIVSLLLVN